MTKRYSIFLDDDIIEKIERMGYAISTYIRLHIIQLVERDTSDLERLKNKVEEYKGIVESMNIRRVEMGQEIIRRTGRLDKIPDEIVELKKQIDVLNYEEDKCRNVIRAYTDRLSQMELQYEEVTDTLQILEADYKDAVFNANLQEVNRQLRELFFECNFNLEKIRESGQSTLAKMYEIDPNYNIEAHLERLRYRMC